jgi:2-polyprenyl-3-methyl-5-hydroxy-6-metoxy-1,4-benzoquinol methylase
MPLEPHQVEEIAHIMGVSEDMLDLLPKLVHPTHAMNPWVEQLPGVFSQLDLKPGQTILDIPCGTGRVSVPLAKMYQTQILGFDILPAYIESAQAFAQRHQVEELCDFSVADIRSVVERQDICDLLLWIAPPHIWQSTRETVAHATWLG